MGKLIDWLTGPGAQFDDSRFGTTGMDTLNQGNEALNERKRQANAAQMRGDMNLRNYGTPLATLARDKMRESGAYDTRIGAAAANVMGDVVQTMGDMTGGMLRGNEMREKADAAAGYAGAMAEAQNSQARAAIMKQAEGRADAMNLQNAARTADITDGAIAGMNAYESGMAGIGMSGIEGSENMERNLEYGKNRAEGEAQMQYDMMGMEAQNFSDSMANSFSDLSQGKSAAMQGAWSGSMADSMAGLTAEYGRIGQEVMAVQPTNAEYAGLEEGAMKADAAAGTTPVAEGAPAAVPPKQNQTDNEYATGMPAQAAPPAQAAVPEAAAQQPAAEDLSGLSLDELIRRRDAGKGGADKQYLPNSPEMIALQNEINRRKGNSKRY
jgi:hypothetical protein